METIKHLLPADIEKNSFLIIKEELKKMQIKIPEEVEPVVMRVIHTTADFDYVSSLCFSENALSIGINALKNGAAIVTDTNMALAGINKSALKTIWIYYNTCIKKSQVKIASERSASMAKYTDALPFSL